MGFYYGYYMWIILPALLLGLYAQTKIKSTYQQYSRIGNGMGLTGYEMARRILDRHGLGQIQVTRTNGRLSDHYDPRDNVLRLSPEVHDGQSIASICIAAHEAGHALQDAKDYRPFLWRNRLFPIAATASQLFWIFFLVGILMAPRLIDIGIILFAVGVLFQIVTLPVEFDASSRAVAEIEAMRPNQEVIYGSKKVLKAAALTYVASAAMAISQLLRFFMMANRRR